MHYREAGTSGIISYLTISQLLDLINWLDAKGSRESRLRDSLTKHKQAILKNPLFLHHQKLSEEKATDGSEDVQEGKGYRHIEATF